MRKGCFVPILKLLLIGIVLLGMAGCATKKHIIQKEKVTVFFKDVPKGNSYYISSSGGTQDEVADSIRSKIKNIVKHNKICLNGKTISIEVNHITYSKMVAGNKIQCKIVCQKGDEHMGKNVYFKVVALDDNIYIIEKKHE